AYMRGPQPEQKDGEKPAAAASKPAEASPPATPAPAPEPVPVAAGSQSAEFDVEVEGEIFKVRVSGAGLSVAAAPGGAPSGANSAPAPPKIGEDTVLAPMLDLIVKVAHDCGADAIHPGYGFLAEKPAFPEACDAAGIKFIGPPASAMRALGSKLAARQLAAKHGVPVTPGSGAVDAGTALEAARKIGFPVMLKPAGGGGGGRIRQRGDGRVHLHRRPFLLPRGQCAAAGGASDHRGRDRHRPRQGADPRRRGPRARLQAARRRMEWTRDRDAHQRRGPAAQFHPQPAAHLALGRAFWSGRPRRFRLRARFGRAAELRLPH